MHVLYVSVLLACLLARSLYAWLLVYAVQIQLPSELEQLCSDSLCSRKDFFSTAAERLRARGLEGLRHHRVIHSFTHPFIHSFIRSPSLACRDFWVFRSSISICPPISWKEENLSVSNLPSLVRLFTAFLF